MKVLSLKGNNKTARLIIAVCVLLAFVWIGRIIFKKKPHKQMPPRPVETAIAIKDDVPVYLEGFGNFYPPNDVDIKSQVTGTVMEINFTEGKEVVKGELLFTIDPSIYQAQLDSARAALMQDLADLKLKKVTFERNKILFEKQLISRQDFDKYEAELAASAAKVRNDSAEIELARINLGYCYIRSPVNGLTGKRQVDIGNVVSANTGPTLVNIKTIDSLYVDFTIPETDLFDVRAAMKEGKLKVEVSIDDQPGGPYEGTIEVLDNTVDNTTGTVSLRAVVPNDKRALWAGQFVKVKLILGIEKNAVLLPYQAVQIGQMGSYVFVVSADNKADLRPVVTGSRQGENIVIRKGVSLGEKVVTVGQLGLSPQATVIDVTQQKTTQLPDTARTFSQEK